MATIAVLDEAGVVSNVIVAEEAALAELGIAAYAVLADDETAEIGAPLALPD